jgi:hypothetical protein
LRYRIKCAAKILFNGSIEYEEAFIFRGEKHIRDLISALYEGLNRLKKEKGDENDPK